MDYTLDVGTGFECLDDMLKVSRDFKAIMLSSQKDKNLELESKKRRVESYLQKPVEFEELVQVIEFIKDRYAKVTWVRNKVAEVSPEAVEVAMGSMLACRALVEEVGTVAGVRHEGKNVVYMVGVAGLVSGSSYMVVKERDLPIIFPSMHGCTSDVVALEVLNVIVGDIISCLNREDLSLGMRLTPAVLINGSDISLDTILDKVLRIKVGVSGCEFMLYVNIQRD